VPGEGLGRAVGELAGDQHDGHGAPSVGPYDAPGRAGRAPPGEEGPWRDGSWWSEATRPA
jgi:hypothetical protein